MITETQQTRQAWQRDLYQKYHQKVFGICLYFLKDREEARDASHDVFLKVFRGWNQFEWKCEPMTWIGAIAKHDCFSRLQKRKKHLERRAQFSQEEEVLRQPEPEEDLVVQKLRLQKYLPAVHGKLREILRLNLEGLNHREIAIRMGVSRVAITRRLTRFRKNMLAKTPQTLTLTKSRPARPAKPQLMLQENEIRLRAA